MPTRPTVKDVDVRVSVLESKHEELKESICEAHEANTTEHRSINKKLDGIQTHIAKQNGALPFIKEAVIEIRTRLNGLEDDQHETDVKVAGNSIKGGFIWGLVVAAAGAAIVYGVNLLIGAF